MIVSSPARVLPPHTLIQYHNFSQNSHHPSVISISPAAAEVTATARAVASTVVLTTATVSSAPAAVIVTKNSSCVLYTTYSM
jgi:hypothetical protein